MKRNIGCGFARSELLPTDRMEPLIDEAGQLGNIIGQSIVTARSNSKKRSTAPPRE